MFHRFRLKIRRRKLAREVKKAKAFILKADGILRRMNMSRTTRKQLWHDFIRSEEARDHVIDMLDKGFKA